LTLPARSADEIISRPPEPLSASERLAPSVVATPAAVAARALLGTLIVREHAAGRRVARIVETEAYGGPDDRASHARAGRTRRTSVMFGPPGRAYVYLVYGMHHCLNVVCGSDGQAAAVLIRAVEPVEGMELMRQRRGRGDVDDARLGAGPALTCRVLDIDRGLDGVDLLADRGLWLARDVAVARARDVLSGPRIGVEYAGPEWAVRPWRFGIAGSPSLSRPFPAHG
jgi:DNA-3-methyladenine glycosylase